MPLLVRTNSTRCNFCGTGTLKGTSSENICVSCQEIRTCLEDYAFAIKKFHPSLVEKIRQDLDVCLVIEKIDGITK